MQEFGSNSSRTKWREADRIGKLPFCGRILPSPNRAPEQKEHIFPVYGVCYRLSGAFGRLVYGGGLLGAGELDNLGLLLAIPLAQAACRRGHGVYCRCLGNHQYYGSIFLV